MKKGIVSVQVESLSARDTIIPIIIIGFLFFIFGFISWLNSILIPYFKIACELTNFESYLVAFAFYISYLVFSVPSSYLLNRVGYKRGIMIGFWVIALGAFIFIPAALTRAYQLFLLGLFTIGAGTALLQTAANPYITILGPKERALQRISIMGIMNKAAGVLAPLLFAAVILKATDAELFRQIPFMSETVKNAALDELIRRVILPYACMGVVLLGLGLLIRYSPLPEIANEDKDAGTTISHSQRGVIFKYPHLILGAVAIFLHIGTQVLSIDTIISYAASMHIGLLEAKVFPSYTLFTMVIGYIIGIVCIPRFVSQLRGLQICTVLGLVLTLLIIYAEKRVDFLGHDAKMSIWFVVLLGLPNSLIWGGIWPLALEGLGRFTKLGSAILIMGLTGNALMPLLYGYLADVYTPHDAYWVLFPCFLFLVYYAFYGYRVRRWSL
ncbi:MAG TPA: sugar MFS transporter [Chitinophagaceae bacterium]|nr:sugar MFS transporter [Chitinophagaceae bacterium]